MHKIFSMLEVSYILNIKESNKIAKIISDNLKISDIILLNGDLGAGKTHLIKQICSNINSNSYISSPSFGIYHQYNLKKLSVWHYDLYRLQDGISQEELLNLDFEEAISNNAVIIEWAKKLNIEINKYMLSIKIDYSSEQMETRKYIISFLEESKWNGIFNLKNQENQINI